jgi:lipoyl(octanoyl) transferase
VGLRVRKGCSYHGLSLNNNMDLTPFKAINPCGFKNLEMTQLINHNVSINNDELAIPLVHSIYQHLS